MKQAPPPNTNINDKPSPVAEEGRSGATRLALIEAGLELFGQLGYHAASSRALADAAEVNQALIGYHFGSKRGLYLAVFEHIGDRIGERMGPVAASIEARLEAARDGAADRGVALRCLLDVVDGFVELMTVVETRSWAMLIVREQQQPSDAFDVLWGRLMGRMLRLLTRLVATLRGRPSSDEEIRLTALTVIGQVLVFRMAASTVQRQMEWGEIGPAERAAIQRTLHRNLEAIFSQENEHEEI